MAPSPTGMTVATGVSGGNSAAVVAAVFVNDGLALMLILLLSKDGVPQTTDNAAEAQQEEQRDTSECANDNTGDGSAAQLVVGGTSSVLGLVSTRSAVGRASTSRSDSGISRLDTAGDNSRGSSDSERSGILRSRLAVLGHHNRLTAIHARLGGTLTFEGASLPSSAANRTTLLLVFLLGYTIDSLRGLRRRGPKSTHSARVSVRLGPCGGVLAELAIACHAGGYISSKGCAVLAGFAAELVI